MDNQDTMPEGLTEERLAKGFAPIFECTQRIACNPCLRSCPQGAVQMPDSLNDAPRVDYSLCNGCGICMSVCPGLAIFCVHMNYTEHTALLKLPYEFIPLPEEGDLVKGCDREGREVGRFRVEKIREEMPGSCTYIVSLRIPKEYAMRIRSIRAEDGRNEG